MSSTQEPWQKPGFVGTPYQNFFRRAAHPLVLLLKPTSIMPNHLTIAAIFLYLLVLVNFSSANRIAGVVGVFLLYSISILDRADGQLARLRGQTSTKGEFLDGFLHNVGPICVYTGLGVHAYTQTSVFWFLLAGPLTACLILAHNYNYLNRVHLLENPSKKSNKIGVSKVSGYKNVLYKLYTLPSAHLPEFILLAMITGLVYVLSAGYLLYHLFNLVFFLNILSRFPQDSTASNSNKSR